MASSESIGFVLADLSRLMRRAFRKGAESGGLSLAQARILLYLSKSEGMRQVDLAEWLDVQPITLARSLDHLQKHGMVERRADPDDRRAFRLFLLPAAQPHLMVITAQIDAIRTASLRGFSADEADALLIALKRMRDNLGARTE